MHIANAQERSDSKGHIAIENGARLGVDIFQQNTKLLVAGLFYLGQTSVYPRTRRQKGGLNEKKLGAAMSRPNLSYSETSRVIIPA